MTSPLTRYLAVLKNLAQGHDPGTHPTAAMWAEYQRLLGVEVERDATVADLERKLAELSRKYEIRREQVRFYQDQVLGRRWDQALEQLWREAG